MAEKVLSASNKALTLAQRKHIKDNQVHYDKHMGRIEAATGSKDWSYDFEGDIAAFGKALKTEKDQEMFGGVLSAAYLSNIAEMFEKNFKDAFIKEAALAALTAKQIIFKPLEQPVPGSTQHVKIEDGKLYIGCVPSNFWTNLGDISNTKFEKLIGATASELPAGERVLSENNPTLSLIQRKHIRDNQVHLKKHLDRIEKATGLSGWTYDVEGDFATFIAGLKDAREKELVGGTLSAAYMNSIAEMFEKGLKDAMVKEAFLEAVGGKKKIVFKPLTEAPKSGNKYQEVKIEDGVLYIGCIPKDFWTNINEISNQKLEKIIPAGGAGNGAAGAASPSSAPAAGEKVLSDKNATLSLTQRKNIRDNQVHLEKHLKRIEAATGVSGWTYDFEGDIADFGSKIKANDRDMFGGVLCAAYLDNIAQMLEKQMKDDMIKEAFLEAVPDKKIVFKPLTEKPKAPFGYQQVSIENGKLTIGCLPEGFWTNLNEISSAKLEKLL